MVQSAGGFSRTAAAAAASGHQAARAAGSDAGHFPGKPRQAGNVRRPLGRDSRPVREIYALWRPTPLLRAVRLEKALQTPAHIYYKYEGASPAGSHKANTSVAAGLLQQGRRHQAAGHGNRRGPMGFVAGAGVQAVRTWNATFTWSRSAIEQKPYRRMLMHTWGATVHPSPSDQTEYGRKVLARGPAMSRQPRHRHQRSHRRHRQASEHQILAGQRAESRLPAPDRHRPGSHPADGNGRRGAGRDLRLLRRRQQFRRAGVSVPSQKNQGEEKISHRRRRAVRLPVADQGRTALRFWRHGGDDAAADDVHAGAQVHAAAASTPAGCVITAWRRWSATRSSWA